MNTTTFTKVLTSDLVKEVGKAYVYSAATMAGIVTGITVVGLGVEQWENSKKKRAAKKQNLENER